MMLEPAVDYIRMSTDDQAASPDRQISEIQKAFGEKYNIIRRYDDEGMSGSKEVEKRIGFQRMIQDSSSGDFKYILCWDAARFARMDIIDLGQYISILRKNGVKLHTVKEGLIDWDKPEGRWLLMACCETSKGLSVNLSRDSISQKERMAEEGNWCHHYTPYGYNKVYSNGQQTITVKKGENGRTPKKWRVDLVVNEDEAKVVRWVFDEFVNQGQPMKAIARALNEQGVPIPWQVFNGQGRRNRIGWTGGAVRRLLERKEYIGIVSLGGKSSKKQHHNQAKHSQGKGSSVPPLVSDHVWYDAQRILTQNGERHVRTQGKNPGALSGILFCGHCGCALAKAEGKKTRWGKVLPTYYYCQSKGYGANVPCATWQVYETEIIDRVCLTVLDAVDCEVAELLKVNTEQVQAPDTVLLEEHIVGLRKRLDAGYEKVLTVNPALREGVEGKLIQWKTDLAEAEKKLELAKAVANSGGVKTFAEWWKGTKSYLLAKWGAKECRQEVVDGLPDELLAELRQTGQVVNPNNGNEWLTLDKDGKPVRTEVVRQMIGKPVRLDKDGLRGLLNRLGVSVACFWRPKLNRKGMHANRYELDWCRVKVEVSWTGDGFLTEEPHGCKPYQNQEPQTLHFAREILVPCPAPSIVSQNTAENKLGCEGEPEPCQA